MKKLSGAGPLALLAVALPGVIGMWVIARTLAAYWQRDAMATAVVATMGVVLALGLIELLVRQLRAARLEQEVEALPRTPSEATLDGTSPLLAALLRARLEQAPTPNMGESFAPYLTGLLVMLGLLGTLLGLFDTVHGASTALSASGDVNALRASLSSPIAGLTRSFGCSAAGISASAMLGLSLALVRRMEGRALRAVHTYASGPLRPLSPARRQAHALEQLAAQQLALPQAVTSLSGVGEQLGALANRLTNLQSASLESQQQLFRQLVTELRSEFSRLGAQAAGELGRSVAPLLQEAATATRSASEEQARALAELTRDLGRQLGEEALERRREASELITTVVARIDEAERARSTARDAEHAAVVELTSRLGREAQAREEVASARWSELAGRAEQRESRSEELESARLARLDGLTTQIGGELARAAELMARQQAQGEAWIAARQAESEQQVATQRELAERLFERELARFEETLEQQRARALENERAFAAQGERTFAQLSEGARAFHEGLASQRESVERLLAELPALFTRVAESAQSGSREALDALVAGAEARLERMAELMDRDIERRLEREQAQERAAAGALERLSQGAALLDRNLEQQRDALETLVSRVGALFGELADKASASAEITLARLTESAEEQAMRWAKLEGELADARLDHARGLEEQVTTHLALMEERLAQAGSVVQQAAGVWQASSAEMQAVAELFAKSVERQREASEAWLESLGDIEAAVDRSGRHAAADALSDQLASTQEVFARQLQFQRELFEQLRSLRTTRPATVEHELGGSDVSV